MPVFKYEKVRCSQNVANHSDYVKSGEISALRELLLYRYLSVWVL
ncbi:MAG: hypothetical protein R3A80_09105 [Bdellovibrionota bacterium]